MKIKRRFDQFDIELLIGSKTIADATDSIEPYQSHCNQDGQSSTPLNWFLAKRAIWDELPVVLISRRNDVVQGVVLLHYPKAFGIPYGLVRGGMRGENSVIAPLADQRQLLETAARFLVHSALAHTVVLTVPYRVETTGQGGADRAIPARWFVRDEADHLNLAGGFDATMGRLSYKLRRNLRYYRRRAENSGEIQFLPELTPAQRRDAVSALFSRGRYPTPLRRARRWEAALQAVPGAFAMGLRSTREGWLSYVAGWREPSTTYMDWQLNDEREATSTVMRSYLLGHETGRNAQALVFVGGTSPIWARACEPATASDLIVVGTGLVSRALRRAFWKLRPGTDVAILYDRMLASRQGNRFSHPSPRATRPRSS